MTNESEKPRLPGEEADETRPEEDGAEESGLTVEEAGNEGLAEEEEYRLVGEATPSGESAARTADWYYTIGRQPRQGPVSLGDLQRLVAAGQLGRADRVWRSGLPEWAAVADVPELGEEPGPPPPPPRPVAARDEDRRDDPLAGLRGIERMLTEPRTLRAIGWSCAGLGAFVGAISIPLAFLWRSWFTGALLLLLASLVLHVLARIVETLERP